MEENKIEAQDNQQNADNSGKIAKQYEANINKLTAVLRGKENIYPSKKIEEGTIGDLVTELLKEQKEEIAKTVKTDLKALLDKKVQLDKEVKAGEESLKKLKETKQKDFNEACSKIFSRIGGIEQLEKDYYSSLGGNNTAEEKK